METRTRPMLEVCNVDESWANMARFERRMDPIRQTAKIEAAHGLLAVGQLRFIN